jgi:hypothetical protein
MQHVSGTYVLADRVGERGLFVVHDGNLLDQNWKRNQAVYQAIFGARDVRERSS